jgi:hypothetical protein
MLVWRRLVKTGNINDGSPVTFLCASCPSADENLILTLPVAEQLYQRCQSSTNSCDDVDNQGSESDNEAVGGGEPVTSFSASELNGATGQPTVAVVTRSQQRATSADVEGGQAVDEGNVVDKSSDSIGSETVDRAVDDGQQDCAGDIPPVLDVDCVNSNKDWIGIGDSQAFAEEQRGDSSLSHAFELARAGKGNYVVHDGLLYRVESYCGQQVTNLVVPMSRRIGVLKLAHDNCHLAGRKTYERIISSGLTWGSSLEGKSVRADAIDYAARCPTCQAFARRTIFDRVPIRKVPIEPELFRNMQMDILGPLSGAKLRYNYALWIICTASHYPFAYPLTSPTAKNVCNALIKMFETTGLCRDICITSDNASYFKSSLVAALFKRLGVSPRFSTPYHPLGHSVIERNLQSLQRLIAKLAGDHQNNWTDYLGTALWCLRETRNEVTGVAPHLFVLGYLPLGPLAILRESWSGERELPVAVNSNVEQYLANLRQRLDYVANYAMQHAHVQQDRYVSHYNKRARDKHFDVGEKCLILQPSSTSSAVFSRWKGPATIVTVRSPYSYVVDYNGTLYHLHANSLRKFREQTSEATCNGAMFVTPEVIDEVAGVCHCSIIYEKDVEFGDITTVDPPSFSLAEPLPSQRIDLCSLEHLQPAQRKRILELVDDFASVFSDVPGLCTAVEHEIPLVEGFRPRIMRAYKVPLKYQADVDKHISELLRLGFIEPSVSPQVSPLVCVLKPKDKDGNQAIRTCVDYRFVNKFTQNSASILEDISTIIQEVGKAHYISKFDANSGYYQCPVKDTDRWLTAFVHGTSVYQWCRTPFGMKTSGDTYVRSLWRVLQPVREFTKSYVDETAVYSNTWAEHLEYLRNYLQLIKASGFRLGLRKCEFAKPSITFLGHVIGSGKRSIDPSRVYEAVAKIKYPETKKAARRVTGFFSFWREYIPSFSEIAKPLTDLTMKRVPEKIPFSQPAANALKKLKFFLCEAVKHPLSVIDMSKPFIIYCDSSNFCVGACLAQNIDGSEYPVAFASAKLTKTQQGWSTIEKEAYAALWALQKFKQWIFGNKVTVNSDHNSITFLTETTPKSAKLMRWSLAIQEFDVHFKYKRGDMNTVADCLSRDVLSEDDNP